MKEGSPEAPHSSLSRVPLRQCIKELNPFLPSAHFFFRRTNHNFHFRPYATSHYDAKNLSTPTSSDHQTGGHCRSTPYQQMSRGTADSSMPDLVSFNELRERFDNLPDSDDERNHRRRQQHHHRACRRILCDGYLQQFCCSTRSRDARERRQAGPSK